MAELQPFRGLRYNPQLAGDLELLLCPPYDVIAPEEQRKLHEVSPYNAVRLELGESHPSDSEGSNRYTRAAALLEEWLNQEILLPEREAAFYLLQEKFSHMGHSRTRHSLLARLRLEEFSRKTVIPHEETLQGPKRDRLEMLKATRANLSPIMGIYHDPSGEVSSLLGRVVAPPPTFHTHYGDSHIRLWAVHEERDIETIRGSLKDTPIYLADGHHRYETALHYRDMQRANESTSDGEGSHNFVMAALIDINDPGLLALPYHRLVRGLSPTELQEMEGLVKKAFTADSLATRQEQIGDGIHSLEEQLEGIAREQVAFVMLKHGAGAASILTMRDSPGASSQALERCAAWVMAKNILEPVLGTQEEGVQRGTLRFTHDADEVSRLVSNGDFQVGFLLPAMPLDLFEEVVGAGKRLPIKSTYFSPKVPTGLVINRLV
jgi:uncharacterized protein (DUF1015 family)